MAFKENLGGAVWRGGVLAAGFALACLALGEPEASVGLAVGYAVTSLNLWLLTQSLMRVLHRRSPGPGGRFVVARYLLRFVVFTLALALLARWSGKALLGAFGGVFIVKIMIYLEGIRGPGRKRGDRNR